MLRWLGDLALNTLLALDMGLNVALLGMPGETVSHRVARMRKYGGPVSGRVGCVLCRALTVMFWLMRRDHCSWALDGQDGLGVELWRWSK